MQAGLKTGMYYLRTRAAADAIKFTVDQQALQKRKAERAGRTSSVDSPTPLKVQCSPHRPSTSVTDPFPCSCSYKRPPAKMPS